MSESSVIEELVDQLKKSRKRGHKSSRGSRVKYKNSVTSSELPLSKKSSKSSKGLFGGLLGDLGKNKMFIIGLAILLVIAIAYYLMNKNKKDDNKTDNITDNNNNKNNDDNNINELHMKKVKEILQKRDEYERENNIVKLKLPEKYLTDEQGRPVILTPQVIQKIKNQPIHVNQNPNNNNDNNNKNTHELNDSENLDDEDDNVQSQNLTKEEMEELKNQLEQMDSNVMASNSSK